jgi:hypothetical protein
MPSVILGKSSREANKKSDCPQGQGDFTAKEYNDSCNVMN